MPLIIRTACTQNHRQRKSRIECVAYIRRPGPARTVNSSSAATLRLRSNYQQAKDTSMVFNNELPILTLLSKRHIFQLMRRGVLRIY